MQCLSSAKWTRFDGFLLVYFYLPVPIFLLGFFSPWIGVPAAAMAIVAFVKSAPFFSIPTPHVACGVSAGTALLIIFAAAWTSLGGAGHTFYANEIDWVTRYAVLRDLIVFDWPPRYFDEVGNELILRAPFGYYMVPAVLGKLAGIAWADLFLMFWTWLGVTLFFVANFAGSMTRRIVVLTLFAIASGLDIVGFLWMSDGYIPSLGYHIEWWSNRMKYSSNSTMLYWIPNHALPGWALGAWLWRFQHSPVLLRRLPLIALVAITWSPLTVVGALPMASVLAWRFRRELLDHGDDFQRGLVYVFLPGFLIASYLVMSAGNINSWAFAPPSGTGFLWWQVTLLFIVLEVLVFGVLAQKCSESDVLTASLLMLCLLPFFRFGPANDLVTIAGIPGLTIIWLTLINELASPLSQRRLSPGLRAVLFGSLLLGAVTPFQETYRALTEKHWSPDLSLASPVAMRGFQAHYFASAANWLSPALKESRPSSAEEINLKNMNHHKKEND
jgi:hypothetical protein